MALTQVTSDGIATGAVTVNDISDGSISTAKIADDAVTADKLANTSVTAGSYTLSSITVDAQGRITSASSGTAGDTDKIEEGNTNVECVDTGSDGHILFDTEGSERMRITSSGNVGINESSPSAALHVNSGGTNVVADFESTDANAFIQIRDNSTTDTGVMVGANGDDMLLRAGTNERVRITSSGNVGIGTASPGDQLHIHTASSGAANVRFSSTDVSNGFFVGFDGQEQAQIWHTAGKPIRIATNNTERMRIDSDGRLLLGLSSSIGGEAIFQVQGSSNRKAHFHQPDSGGSIIQFTNTTTGTGTSDGFEVGLNGSEDGQIWLYESGDVKFGTANTERVRIDSSGRLLVGTTSGDGNTKLHVSAAENNSNPITTDASIVIANTQNAGSNEAAALKFNVGNTNSASISGHYDSFNAGVNSSLRFRTQYQSAFNSPTERMRIHSTGRISMAHDGSYWNHGLSLSVSASNNGDTHVGRNTNASFSNSILYYYTSRTSNSAFNYVKLAANNASDNDFILRGDGNAYADGSWNGGGADYAEYFEWSDGNTSAEDRRGISVVLDGDKIREAVDGEEPIGVISGNPSVVGDSDIDRWKSKYLRDDYGTYIQEDYEVEDDDGNTVVQKRRKLNPEYNPNTEYVSRENRPEWDVVGLMGKLRIRKGQVTGTRWIKMRDVSDTVEEWLVR